jgi:hypothetical protein
MTRVDQLADDAMIVKYHSAHTLLTVDLNTLFTVVLHEFTARRAIEVIQMIDAERRIAEESSDDFTFVRQRFWILVSSKTETKRRTDLEEEVELTGTK